MRQCVPFRLKLAALVVVPVVLLQPVASAAQPVEAEALVWRQVTTDCTSKAEALRGQLELIGDPTVPALLAALLVDGPGEERLQAQREFFGREWDRFQAFVETEPQIGLTPEQLALVVGEPRESYVERETTAFVAGVRERAALALALIGSEVSSQLLEQARTVGDDALQTTIDLALEQVAGSPGAPRRSPRAAGKRKAAFRP